MSYDGIFTHLMVDELNKTITQGRISKIHQPYENELMMVVRNKGKNHVLLLSAHPSYARVQLTNISYKNPSSPPDFCMVLRKYLEGSILLSIEQLENDRVISFTFSSRNELGDLEDILLIVELMGRHSNIVLLNRSTNKIIDVIKHVGSSQNSYRLLLPGVSYIAPPAQDKYNPWNIEDHKLFELINTTEELSSGILQESFQGLGRDTASELSYRLQKQAQDKFSTWHHFFTELQTNTSPSFYRYQNKEYFTPLPFLILGEDKQTFDTLSSLLDYFYEGKAERDRVKQQAGELIRKVKNDQDKITKKIKKLERSLDDADNAEIFRVKGELLTTFIHQIDRGVTEVTLDNYYENNEPITISMNQALSPSQNAQKYFQRYQKLKNGVKVVKEQLELAKYELLYLESVASQLELASPKDVDIIKEELIAEKYIKPKAQNKRKKQEKKSKPDTYYSSDGTLISVGKNNLQNDILTLKTAKKTDVWLHAKNIPGSHVIISSNNPSEETLFEAALLAAFHSKFRLSSQVPIDYVQVKHVKKPNGAKPGYVIYENQKTLFVTPDKELIEKIHQNNGGKI